MVPVPLHEVRLLGRPTMRARDGAWSDLKPGLTAALLGYLAFESRWVERGELAALFWPDRSEEVARSNLRPLLWRIAHEPMPVALERERARVRWPVRTDHAAFVEACRAERWKDAWALHGELLAGVSLPAAPEFDTWLELERATVQGALRTAGLRAAEEATRSGDDEAAADRARRSLPLGPLRRGGAAGADRGARPPWLRHRSARDPGEVRAPLSRGVRCGTRAGDAGARGRHQVRARRGHAPYVLREPCRGRRIPWGGDGVGHVPHALRRAQRSRRRGGREGGRRGVPRPDADRSGGRREDAHRDRGREERRRALRGRRPLRRARGGFERGLPRGGRRRCGRRRSRGRGGTEAAGPASARAKADAPRARQPGAPRHGTGAGGGAGTSGPGGDGPDHLAAGDRTRLRVRAGRGRARASGRRDAARWSVPLGGHRDPCRTESAELFLQVARRAGAALGPRTDRRSSACAPASVAYRWRSSSPRRGRASWTSDRSRRSWRRGSTSSAEWRPIGLPGTPA
jgi:hypothetical protein